ncbi:hypothetical protein ABK040_009110 [Willaertia magna]
MSLPYNQYVTLNSGMKMPLLGLGTWLSEKEPLEKAIEIALENNYKHIDTAAIYLNEKEIGKTLNKLINQEKKYKREDLFITSKLWNTFHGKEHVRNAFLKTLQDLQVDYLDLYLIHWPISFNFQPTSPLDNNTLDNVYNLENEEIAYPMNEIGQFDLGKGTPLIETWKEMEKLVDEGLVKSIGVSNFNVQSIIDLLSYARIKPSVNQVECHPYLNQQNLLNALEDIVMVAYSPLGHFGEQSPVHDEKIKELALKYNKTPTQIILRWNIQRHVPVIPKSITKERIIENSKVFDFNLTNEEMEMINQLGNDKKVRTCDPMNFFGIPLFN